MILVIKIVKIVHLGGFGYPTLAMIVFKCLHGLAQSYQADDCVLASAVVGRRRLRSADTMKLLVRRTIRLSSAPETLQFRPQPFGTVYFKYFYYVAVTPTYCYTLRRASSETWNTTAVFPYQTLGTFYETPTRTSNAGGAYKIQILTNISLYVGKDTRQGHSTIELVCDVSIGAILNIHLYSS